jgi:WD40 repeat protein
MDNINDQYMVTVSNANSAPFLIEIWDLTAGTLYKSFSDCQDEVTSVHYFASSDLFFVSSKDNTIRSYGRSVFNNEYQLISVEYTDSFGIPYAMST